VLVKKAFKLVEKDSLKDEFRITYESDTIYIQSRDSLLKAIFYDREIVHPSNLPFSNGENSVSNLFVIPIGDGNFKLRRFGFLDQST
jgi:hypothetical protein